MSEILSVGQWVLGRGRWETGMGRGKGRVGAGFWRSWETERDVWEEEEGQREDGGTWEGRNKNPSQWAQREEWSRRGKLQIDVVGER